MPKDKNLFEEDIRDQVHEDDDLDVDIKEKIPERDTSPLDLRRRVESQAKRSFLDEEDEEEGASQSPLPLFRKLQDRDTNFVFLFGKQQAGKTVIISSLTYHLGTDAEGHLQTRRRYDNLRGASYLKNLYKLVRSGNFMDRNAVGSLYELDLQYAPARPRQAMHLTFLEMSGEDLSKVELSEHSVGQLPDNIDIYLKCPGLNLVFLLVVPYSEAEDHDYLMIDFLDYLGEKNPKFNYSKVILLISKWDRYEGRHAQDVEAFVKEHMPRTFSRLKARSAAIGQYSIGEVNDTNEYIVDFNHERPEAIKRWLYKTITGKKIRSSTPWYKKIGIST